MPTFLGFFFISKHIISFFKVWFGFLMYRKNYGAVRNTFYQQFSKNFILLDIIAFLSSNLLLKFLKLDLVS